MSWCDAAEAAQPRVAYTIPLNPFLHMRNSPTNPLMNGPVPGIHVLPLHLAALDGVPSRLAAVLLMLPRDPLKALLPGYEDMLERQLQVRRRLTVELFRIANNSLGGHGMYLHAFHTTRGRFDYYIFCEDDYLPSRAHFDQTLVRLYRRAFPLSSTATTDGVLAGILQGRPVEPSNRWPLHLETSHIMSAGALDTLSRRTYAGRRNFKGSISKRMFELMAKHRIRDSYTFGAIQGAFGLLLADAGLRIREWAGAYRSPYWDHAGGLVDWSGAASNFTVPPGRHIFVPVQWLFVPHFSSSCFPAPPPRSNVMEGVNACRVPMRAGRVLQRDGPVCGCNVTLAEYGHLVNSRAQYTVRDDFNGSTLHHTVARDGSACTSAPRENAVDLSAILAHVLNATGLLRRPISTDLKKCTAGFAAEDYCKNRCDHVLIPELLPPALAATTDSPIHGCTARSIDGEWRGQWIVDNDPWNEAHKSVRWAFGLARRGDDTIANSRAGLGCPPPQLPSHQKAAEAVRGARIVIIGDCIARYQYLSLVYFLETGSWGPSVVDPQTLEKPGVTSLPESISVGFSMARQPESGKTQYNKMYTRSNALLGGHERCDCGLKDEPPKGVRFRHKFLEDRFENRYYRNTELNVSVSFFFVKGSFSIHGHGHVGASAPLHEVDADRWHHASFRSFLVSEVKRLRPTVLMLNIGLWWFKPDFPRRAANASWWEETLDMVEDAVGSAGRLADGGHSAGTHLPKIIYRTTTTTVPWRKNDNDGVDQALIQTNEVDTVVRQCIARRRKESLGVAWTMLDTYAMTRALPQLHCRVSDGSRGGSADLHPLKFFADDMHFQPFVYREMNVQLLDMIAERTARAGGG
jgi:hypothetical protein